MASDREELDWIRQIAAEPDDPGLRLVCADWYDERGDPRGEFIRVQLQLAAAEVQGEHGRRLARREHELVVENVRRWNAPLHRLLYEGGLKNRVGARRKPIRGWRYRRGFVEELDVDAGMFAGHAILLSQLGPIRQLILRNVSAGDAVARLAGCPSLRTIRSITIRDHGTTLADLELLAASPHLTGLQAVDLRGTRIPEDAAVAVLGPLALWTIRCDSHPSWPLPLIPPAANLEEPPPVTNPFVVMSEERVLEPRPIHVRVPEIDERDLGCAFMILAAVILALVLLWEHFAVLRSVETSRAHGHGPQTVDAAAGNFVGSVAAGGTVATLGTCNAVRGAIPCAAPPSFLASWSPPRSARWATPPSAPIIPTTRGRELFNRSRTAWRSRPRGPRGTRIGRSRSSSGC